MKNYRYCLLSLHCSVAHNCSARRNNDAWKVWVLHALNANYYQHIFQAISEMRSDLNECLVISRKNQKFFHSCCPRFNSHSCPILQFAQLYIMNTYIYTYTHTYAYISIYAFISWWTLRLLFKNDITFLDSMSLGSKRPNWPPLLCSLQSLPRINKDWHSSQLNP